MRYKRLGCLLFILLQSCFLFAQSDNLESKLNGLKANNDLSNWIYEQLEAANENSEKAVISLKNAQKAAWRSSKTNEEHFAWLNLLNTLGYYQLLDGDILASINSYENALSFFRQHQLLDYDIVEYTFKPLSNNYTRLGDYERALYLQKESVAFQKSYQEDDSKTASIYCNMAISYRSMARLADAQKAIQAGFSQNPNLATQIMLNNIFADVLYDEGNFNKAAKVIEANIIKQANANAENAYWLMSSYTTAGNIYLALKQFTKAKANFSKALKLLNKYANNSRIREKANLYTQIGQTFLAEGKPNEAISYAYKTLATLSISNIKNQVIKNNIYGDNKLVDVFLLLANANLKLKQTEQALTSINLSLLAADKIRHEFAGDRTKERLQAYLKQIAEKGIDISYELYQQTKDNKYLNQILALMEQSKGRTLLDQMERNQRFVAKGFKKDTLFLKKQKLEQAISFNEKQLLEDAKNTSSKHIEALKFDLALVDKAISKKYKYLNEPNFNQEIKLTELAQHRFIEYFIGESDTYIININRQKIENVIKLQNANSAKSTLRDFVQTYFQNGPNAMMNDPKKFFLTSHQVYQLILAPLRIKPNEKLTIIPDGVLGYLSFEGLISKDTYVENISKWPFLIKTNAIDYAFSIKTLQAKRKETSADDFSGLFITHQKGNNAVLKAVETEAGLIKKQVKGNFLFNEEVNAKSFEALFGQSKVMHIGTHAYLSGQNSEPTLDFGKEKMYLFELSAQQNAPSLVVLSACRTADGLLAKGEGIISLSRGFNAVGTAATIASLWNVNDDAAATISAKFYESLLETKDANAALRSAKLHWLNEPKATNALLLPYYWDSMVYVGQNQEISLATPINWLLYGAIIGFALLMLVGYLFLKRLQKT